MRIKQSWALALAVSAAACSDPAGPAAGTRTISANLCTGFAPGVWMAYQNEGGPWVQVTPNSSGIVTFDATEKVSVAMAMSFFGINFTEILNATATELESTANTSCEGDSGDKFISGTVAGLAGEQYARITAGTAISDDATASSTSWLLEGLPNRAVDLVATRYATFSSQPAERVIVRRSVTPANAAIPALNFGTESAALESAVATFTNIMSNGSLSMLSSVHTANGTTADLADFISTPASTTQAVSYVSLPASLRIATDLHSITAAASNSIATNTITHYYQAPAAKTLAFGPIVGEPAITNTVTGTLVRPRMQVASQPEYPSAIVVDFGEAVGQESRSVTIFTTAGYLGGLPATWDVSVPDMSAANYNSAWGLKTTGYNWSVGVYGISGTASSINTEPVDGLTVKSSTRGKVEIVSLRKSRLPFFRR